MAYGVGDLDVRELEIAGDWGRVRQHLPVLMVEDSCGLVVERDGELAAVMVLDHLTYTSACIHIAVPHKWVWREGFFGMCEDYVKNHLGKQRLWCTIPTARPQAIRLAQKLGFQLDTILKGGFTEAMDLLFFSYEV